MTLFPSEKAQLVLPHIEGMSKDEHVLDANDLLVEEDPTIPHGFPSLNLALRGMLPVHQGCDGIGPARRHR